MSFNENVEKPFFCAHFTDLVLKPFSYEILYGHRITAVSQCLENRLGSGTVYEQSAGTEWVES